MKQKLNIVFGALAEPIEKQLAQQGILVRHGLMVDIQRLADAITLLCTHGLLREHADADRARMKLLKNIARIVK